MNTFAAVLNILLNVVLIPRYGFIGAAIATSVSFIILNGLAFVILWRSYSITPFSRWSIRTFVLLPLILIPPAVLLSQLVSLTLVRLPIFGVLAGLATVSIVCVTDCLQAEDEIPLELIENRLNVPIPIIRRYIPKDEQSEWAQSIEDD